MSKILPQSVCTGFIKATVLNSISTIRASATSVLWHRSAGNLSDERRISRSPVHRLCRYWHMRISETQLSGVDVDALRFSFGIACDQPQLSGCRLEINEVPVSMDCPNCGAETRTVSVQQLRCSQCGTPALEIVHGRELDLQAMEILE